MNKERVAGLRSIELAVTDLERSAQFYTAAWGLEQLSEEEGIKYFRSIGAQHHELALHASDTAHLMGITLAVPDRDTVDALARRAGGKGFQCFDAGLGEGSGGAYGVTIVGPEGLRVTLSGDAPDAASSDAKTLDEVPADPTRPSKLTHVVLNSEDVNAQTRFFVDLLGFRSSDSTARMEFLRCGADHHTVALAAGSGLSLNHVAFEMRDIDGLMYGAGRVIENGYPVEWGLGRHGPGNNVFMYFVDPDGFAVEYTTDVEQVDETYVSHDIQYWDKFPKRPCRWGIARKPSERLMAAMSGKLLTKIRSD